MGKSRREFVRKLAYVSPVIVSVPVIPAVASAGSVVTEHPDKPARLTDEQRRRLIWRMRRRDMEGQQGRRRLVARIDSESRTAAGGIRFRH